MCQGRLFTAKDLERTDDELRKFSSYPESIESVRIGYWGPPGRSSRSAWANAHVLVSINRKPDSIVIMGDCWRCFVRRNGRTDEQWRKGIISLCSATAKRLSKIWPVTMHERLEREIMELDALDFDEKQLAELLSKKSVMLPIVGFYVAIIEICIWLFGSVIGYCSIALILPLAGASAIAVGESKIVNRMLDKYMD
jgi:hypothetical protein